MKYFNQDIRSILESIGYSLRDDGPFYRARPLYRDSDNPTSLRINKDTGSFVDFSTGDKGSLAKLISLTTGEETKEVAKMLGDNFYENLFEVIKKPRLKFSRPLSWDDVGHCINDYSYFKKRGISEATQQEFGVKKCLSGKMAGRYVVPVYNEDGIIISFSGRTWFDNNPTKWKILGPKTDCVFPSHLNLSHIKETKKVILVEGISDILYLWDRGIKNCICLFGTQINPKIKSFLMSLDLESIIITTNNEPDNNSIGNIAAETVYNKLSKFFSKKKLKIELPPQKDFAVCSDEEIKQWYNNI
jgi:5S rRNA maturation endonuclease (ribonuclease M5)